MRRSTPLLVLASVLVGGASLTAAAQDLRIRAIDCAALLSVPADLPSDAPPILVPLSVEVGERIGVRRGVIADIPLGAIVTGRSPALPPDVMAAIERACAMRRDILRGSGSRDVLRGN